MLGENGKGLIFEAKWVVFEVADGLYLFSTGLQLSNIGGEGSEILLFFFCALGEFELCTLDCADE